MKPYYESNGVSLYLGDCREIMPTLDLVHAIICDPPYELGFMGKSWDKSGIANDVKMWAECLRVLKPGAHLLSFGGSRTYHRMACAIEDAGFEIRDQIMWIYGSGFPKSLDVSKAIDKAARGVPQGGADPTSPNHGKFKGGCSEENPSGRGFGAGPGQFMKDGRKIIGVSNRGSGASPQKLDNHEKGDTGIGILDGSGKTFYITEPATEAAKQWNGWGTVLKPAHEPVCVARKPLEGTVAANVLKYGTGALNIDGCRVEYDSAADRASATPQGKCTAKSGALAGGTQHDGKRDEFDRPEQKGRWPANVIHDGSEEVLNTFAGYGDKSSPWIGNDKPHGAKGGRMFGGSEQNIDVKSEYKDSGSAARFFYTAKADRDERGEGNTHPTVKPLDLMRYLCKLLCPPSGGILLDPFMGSGSTIIAGRRFYQHCIGIELEEKYAEIAVKRLSQEVLDFGGGE